MKDKIQNAKAKRERKVLGFYIDSQGQIQTLEIGLSEIEKLAILQFMGGYREVATAEIYGRNRTG